MDNTTRRAICLMGSLALSGVATAQEPYPSRTITFVVPFAAGSGTDLSTRQMAASVAKATGVAVLVENRPGANGAIGAQYVARARPDGYTLLVGSATTNAANFAFYPSKLGYEPASFVMVAGLMGAPLALHVAAASPWKTVADLVRAAGQANGAKFNCGCGNAVTQVACEIFKRQTGIDSVTVPYKSNPQSLTDVIGGQLNYAFSDTAASMGLIQGNQLRAIAIAGPERNKALAGVPTFAEQGQPGMHFLGWTGVFAPAGTPPAITEKLNAKVNEWLASPEAAELNVRTGAVNFKMSLQEAAAFAKSEVANWARYIKESNVHPD